MSVSELIFPKGFLWGTATAAHEVEGNNVFSDWWAWEIAKKLPYKSGRACGSWHRWRKDIDLAKSLNTNAYRFSIEWARIEPQEGKFNLQTLKHYESQIKYLHQNGMAAMLTLWHFSLPNWFAQKGGFEKKENLKYFERYVSYVVENLREHPDIWVTLNEPNNIYSGAAYLFGIFPPGKKSFLSFARVFRNLILANKLASRVIHKNKRGPVGIAFHMICFEVASHTNPALSLVRKFSDVFFNKLFLKFVVNDLDFIGVNYYHSHAVRLKDIFFEKLSGNDIKQLLLGERGDIGNPNYPEGIYKTLISLKKYRLPIHITENGLADARDSERTSFIKNHLEWLWQAIKDGVDVRGYFHWSLLDNFEWASGYEPRYGLYSVNYKSLRRKPRQSASVYADICRTNTLSVGYPKGH